MSTSEISEIESSPLNINKQQSHTFQMSRTELKLRRIIGYPGIMTVDQDGDQKILMGPGTWSGIFLRAFQTLFTLGGTFICFMNQSSFRYGNYRNLLYGLIFPVAWSIVCLLYDVYSRRNAVTRVCFHTFLLFTGNLVAGATSFLFICLAAGTLEFYWIEEGYCGFTLHRCQIILFGLVLCFIGCLSSTLISAVVYFRIVKIIWRRTL